MPPRQQSRGASRCTSPQHRRETGRSPPRRVTRTGRLQYEDDARAADELRLVQMRFALCDPSRRPAPSDCITPLKRSSCTFSTGRALASGAQSREQTRERAEAAAKGQESRELLDVSTLQTETPHTSHARRQERNHATDTTGPSRGLAPRRAKPRAVAGPRGSAALAQ
jgi:hypothetical protein